MDSIIFVFIILVSGYLFSSQCIITRFSIVRLSGYRLFLLTGFWGIILFLTSIPIYFLFRDERFFVLVLNFLNNIYQVDTNYEPLISILLITLTLSIVAIIIFEVAIQLLDKIINFLILLKELFLDLIKKDTQNLSYYVSLLRSYPIIQTKLYERSIRGDDIGNLILYSIKQIKLISLSMANGKLYVGWALSKSGSVGEGEYIKILLLYTGYKEANTKQLKIISSYKSLINKISGEMDDISSTKEILKNIEVVVPYTEIKSASLFSTSVYNYLIQSQGSK